MTTKMPAVTVLLLIIAVLLGTACASQELPYDAPQVGVDGVTQVLGVEHYEFPGDDSFWTSGGLSGTVTVVVWRTVREDGRECDEIAFKVADSGAPDLWLSLRHQRPSVFGVAAFLDHASLPNAICLHADVLGVDREQPLTLPTAP